MRTILTALTLLSVAAVAPVAAAVLPACPPNPLTQTHDTWMKMPSGAVDLNTPPPASATNPLMVNIGWVLAAQGADTQDGSAAVNPLTHRQ